MNPDAADPIADITLPAYCAAWLKSESKKSINARSSASARSLS